MHDTSPSAGASELERLNRALAGRYRLLHEIGQGGMATVYRADDLKHDRPVALKVLKPALAAALGPDRFLREITLTARLDHPHILPLLDSGEAEGRLYYVMPLVEGESLRARLDREKQLPIDDALRIAREVADALGYAHAAGIIHRDIKPENILLASGHARVADFGIARAVTVAGTSGLTDTGLAIGTPAYMSPEQASAERDLDARTDVYSLGCVLYEMLAGQAPFTGATAAAILARKTLEQVPSLRVVRDAVPPAVEQAVTVALARVPADRFGSARQFSEALSREQPPAAAAGRPRRGLVIAAGAGLLVVALLVTNAGGLRNRLLSVAPSPRIRSLAVLPLENFSADTTQDYFAAGMHEALIIGLGKLSGLTRVSARPSVLRYRKTEKSPRQIGQELGVDALITGTVLREGDSVRITASLIRAATEEPLWSSEYQREIRNVLALQNDIVTDVARRVRLQLSRSEQAALQGAREVNPEAYQAYLKGKYRLATFTPDGFAQAMAHFRQAIALDPSEPLGYAGLSEGYALMELFIPIPDPDAFPRAKAAAVRALELDETLAIAHVALADIKGSMEWDYDGAEAEFRRALELNPNLPEAHIHYAWHLAAFEHEEEALGHLRRGVELDPLSPLYTAWLAGMYWEFNKVDDAIGTAKKALAMQPDFPVALYVLGLSYVDKGQYAEAIAAHQRGAALYPYQSFTWALARTYALSGRQDSARVILGRLKSGNPGDAMNPWFIAAAFAALGDNEAALDWLEKAYQARVLFLPNLRRARASGATFSALHGHPRFEALLKRVNLAR